MLKARTPLLSLTKQARSVSMAATSFKPSPYDGPSYESVRKTRSEHLSPALLTYYKTPLLIHQGHMQWLFDHQNKRYLDMFGGIVTVSVGHCHPHVTEALSKQMHKLQHTTNIYLHPKIHEYAEKLTARFPGNLKVAYFVNSGSEANDMAMLMARLYTGSFDLLALRNAYHGMSPYTMGLTNLHTWKYNVPQGFGVHHAMNPDPYRGPWGGKNCREGLSQVVDRTCDCAPGSCKASDQYVEQVRDVIRHSTSGKIAGFFAESIQGVGGTVQFPRNYLKNVYEIVRQAGGLTIADEVQTGFGRLGTHQWGFQQHDVVPDIVTMAKGIGNGFPMAAVVTTPEVAKTIAARLHFNTYGGNPMASAVGIATLEVMDKENLQKNCLEVGNHYIKSLMRLRDKHSIVGDVRGQGLMLGVEFVKDRKTRAPANEELAKVFERTKDLGVLFGKGGLYGNVLRIKPPMCITKEDVDFAVYTLDKAISEL